MIVQAKNTANVVPLPSHRRRSLTARQHGSRRYLSRREEESLLNGVDVCCSDYEGRGAERKEGKKDMRVSREVPVSLHET